MLALRDAERALEALEVAGALSFEGLRGSPEPFDDDIQAVSSTLARRLQFSRTLCSVSPRLAVQVSTVEPCDIGSG